MAVIRAFESFDFNVLNFKPSTGAPITSQFTAGSRAIEPYDDSYTFSLINKGIPLSNLTFAGNGLADEASANISAFEFDTFVSGPNGPDVYPSFLIEGIALTRAEADAFVASLKAGHTEALDTLFKVQLSGDDTVYLPLSGYSGSISTYGGNDTIYSRGGGLIDAGAGDDVIDSTGGIADVFYARSEYYFGGTGNDTYILSSVAANVVEKVGKGVDLVQIADTLQGFRYVLPANVENGAMVNTVAGALIGNAGVNTLTGNDVANDLYAAAGNDKLLGAGRR
ncbi:MAG: hypothetical protein ACKVOL_02480 [Novosphingobium sp.]